MENTMLFNKLAALPENLKAKVAEFIESLLSKEINQSGERKPKPLFGSAKGMFVMKPDFDNSIEDFKDYM